MLTFDDIESKCFIFKIHKVGRTYNKEVNKTFNPGLGMSILQFHTLAVLDHYPNQTLTVIAEKLGIDRTTIPRNIKILVRKEMIIYTIRKDKRIRHYHLTEKGREILKKGFELWTKIDHKKYTNILKNSLDNE